MSSAGSDFKGGPPPMDEGWWAAVLREEGEFGPPPSPGAERTPSKAPGWGSAEDWVWARELYEADDTVDLPVIGYNRGGLLVEARSLRGFVPVSHLISVEPDSDDDQRNQVMASLVGDELCLKVIEYDPERGRLVFSQRAAQAGPGKRIELLEQLQSGEKVRGEVTNITPFGVFVDLGGVEGLIHVSELSWGRVRHPADVVHCGQELDVQVLSIDREQSRVALSVKELLPDPWAKVDERFDVGDLVSGVVTNVVKFGAFVGIDEGLEGLVHVSEMSDGGFMEPEEVVREGERVTVRVIHIDAEARRLGLSLRGVDQSGAGPASADDAVHEQALSSY